jgi:hypothetical protein
MSVEVLLVNDDNVRLTWPKGATVPNVGDVIFFSDNERSVIVAGRTFEIAKGQLVRITLSFQLPS